MRFIAVWVRDNAKNVVTEAKVTVLNQTKFTNDDGYCDFNVNATTLNVNVTADGFKDYSEPVTLLSQTKDISVGDSGQMSPDNILLPALSRKSLALIRVDGNIFRDEFNDAWIWRGMDGFRDYEFYRAGQDIRPVLQETASLGANLRRVFFCVASFGNIDPKVPGFYDAIPNFLDLLASYGLYCELTGGDYQIRLPSVDSQRNHLNNLIQQVGTRPAFIEGCNEGRNNGFHTEAWQELSYPSNILTCNASPLTDDIPPAPYREYAAIHNKRGPKWQFAGQDAWFATYGFAGESQSFAGTHKPTVSNEAMGAADYDSGSRSTDAGAFERFARDVATWGSGGVFHSDCGVQSQLLSPTQRSCAIGYMKGLSIV